LGVSVVVETVWFWDELGVLVGLVAWDTSWGEVGCVGWLLCLLDLRLGLWSGWACFVNFVIGHFCKLFSARSSISGVVVVICLLSIVKVVIFVVVAAFVACGVAMGRQGSGLDWDGCRVCGSGVARPGSVFRHFCGV